MRWMLLIFLFINTTNFALEKENKSLIMWYDKPATEWVEALPLGNGRLGAMVFGRVGDELIQLNEETLWSGGPSNLNANPESPKYLAPLREALFRGDYSEANVLSKKMQGVYTQSYAPMADLYIHQKGLGEIEDYYRDLNLNNAISTVRFKSNNTTYTREMFISHPDQVMVIKLSSNAKKQLNLDLSLSSLLQYSVDINDDEEIILNGRAPAHADPIYYNPNSTPVIYKEDEGMRFQVKCKMILKDGEIKRRNSTVTVSNATEVLIYVSGATSFNGFDKCPFKQGKDEKNICDNYLQSASKKTYNTIKKNHIKDYKSLFDRVNFELYSDVDKLNLSLDKRLDLYLEGEEDKQLENLYYQFNRYLLISASRPGGIAMNLQGIWNNSVRPPWSSNYTTNINTQMNYWPVEMVNLSELHEPLLTQIKNMSITGKEITKNFYGLKGWCLHHNSDIWAQTNPVGDIGKGDPMWANWMMGAPWMCQHLYEHYRFNRDKNYLKDFAYPVMKEAAEFILDWLIEDKNGYLVTAPATSPENIFIDENGRRQQVGIATTCDMVLIWDLFTNLIEASEVLEYDDDFRNTIIEKRDKLYPLQIGGRGNLQEWNEDFRDAEPTHRHISHLIGLHPGRQISPLLNPEYANACRKTLFDRGDHGTGWAVSWKINTWARLLDGNHAYLLLRNLLKVTGGRPDEKNKGGGSYRNLFCAHPPFQIDGNFGGLSGMTEMLIQSHLDEIHLLPALPNAWSEGKIEGVKARGNFILDFEWENKKISSAVIYSGSGGECVLRTDFPIEVKNVKGHRETDMINRKASFVYKFQTEKGKKYIITPMKSKN